MRLSYLAYVALALTSLACSAPTPTSTHSVVADNPEDDGGCSACDATTGLNSPPEDCGAPDAGGPFLSSLGITGATLIPEFSPAIHDYYVQCADGPNDLVLSLDAPLGVSTSLSVETPATPTGTLTTVGSTAPQQTVSLSLGEGQAVVATASEGGDSQEYWVRCLPAGFPPNMQWNAHTTGCERTPGYYLIGTMSLGSPGWAIVLDTNGVPVWYSGLGPGPGLGQGQQVYDVETLVPGSISFASGTWQVDQLGVSTTYPVVDGFDGGPPGTPDAHELRVLPNGHLLALSAASQIVDLTGLTLPLADDGGVATYGPNSTILGCDVLEFDGATGEIYWQWIATDHFNPVEVMVVQGDGDLASTSYVEPFHCNSIDVDTSNGDANSGNLLVSARHMDSIFYIEKATGKVLWKMGGSGPASCLDDPPPIFVPVDDPFVCQHDARFQPDWQETCSGGGGGGHISLFDDESYTTNPARAVVYNVIVDGGIDGGVDSGCGDGGPSAGEETSATLAWQYKNSVDGGVPSNVTGSFRIAADGSRTIGWGQSDPSPNGLVFTEVDVDGNDLLDLVCPDDSSTYRAVKVPLTAFDLSVLRSTSGQP
jgi:hypothetical protein